jgi:hypothetical protein
MFLVSLQQQNPKTYKMHKTQTNRNLSIQKLFKKLFLIFNGCFVFYLLVLERLGLDAVSGVCIYKRVRRRIRRLGIVTPNSALCTLGQYDQMVENNN